MAANEATVSDTNLFECPLCGAKLPGDAQACDRCDWVPGYHGLRRPGGNPRDIIAVALSIIPGMGHIYKGHKLTGWLILLGSVVVVFGVGVIATYTAGFGLLLLPFFWLWVMTLAYWIDDKAATPRRVSS